MKNYMLRIAKNAKYFFSFLGIPTFGKEGGQAGWDKIPTR